MKSLILNIVLFAFVASALAQDYPYQPFGLFRYGLFERGMGPTDMIDGVGDQNGDGYDDFVVKAYIDRGRHTNLHSLLFLGGEELDTIPDIYFYSRIFDFGDYNGDGIIDFLVKLIDREHDWYTPNYGIIFGGDLDTLIDVELPIPPDERPHFYKSIGDVNDDGNEDLMLWQRYRNDSLWINISVYSILFCGADYDSFSTWHVATDSLHELRPQVQPRVFGNFDGNDSPDVVIVHQSNGGEDYYQKCYIVHDFLDDEDPDTTDLLEHLPTEEYRVLDVLMVRDINGDGLDEITIRMRSFEEGGDTFFFFFGSEEHDNEPNLDFRDQEFYREYGPPAHVFNIGDVNADGYDDMSFCMRFANAKWGYIFLGGPDMDFEPDALIVSPFEGTRYDGGLGYLIKWAGDVNGNGVDDIIVLSQPENSEMNAVLVVSLDEEFADIKSQPRGDAGLMPSAYLHPPFPSPFNSTVRLDFDLPIASEVSLSIIDITGRVVAEVVDGHFASGSYQRVWTNDTTGMFIVVLQTEGRRSVRKVVICLK